MTECTMVYLPQIGYLLAVKPWEGVELNETDLNVFPDLQFMFLANGMPHYKTPRCTELDEVQQVPLQIGLIVSQTMFVLSSLKRNLLYVSQ